MKNLYVYSRGKFLELSEEFLYDKAIIRIHNIKDIVWYKSSEENPFVLELFFDDLNEEQLGWLDKLLAKLSLSDKFKRNCKPLTDFQAQLLISFICRHQGKKDFIIHCEYGKSRSVAVGVFIANKFGYKIKNKTTNELNQANSWVLNRLNSIKV